MRTKAYVVILCLLFPTAVFASETEIAVVSLDTPRNPDAENIILDTLASAEFNVPTWEAVSKRLEKARSPAPSPEIASKFSAMAPQVSAGIEKFFYESQRSAIEILQPVFDMGMNHVGVLARRPDYADQVFQAGLILIRAYDQTGQKDNANAVRRLIVKTFPTQKFKASVIPPDVYKTLVDEREKIAAKNTTLSLKSPREQCTSYINGVVAPPSEPIPVEPDVKYHLRVDCGLPGTNVWALKLEPEEQAVVPLAATNLSSVVLESGTFQDRKAVEHALSAMLFWAGLDQVIGVSQQMTSNGAVLVVRVSKDKSARWSDGADEEDVYKALVKVFPELDDVERPNQVSGSSGGASTDWLGWGLIGGGVLVAGVSTGLLIPAIDRRNELECAIGTRTDGCDGVEPRDPNSAGYQADVDSVDNRLIVSYVMYGVAAGLVGYGIYRVITFEPEPEVAIFPSYDGDQVHINLTAHF